MGTYELSTNDHGFLAQVIAGRYVDFPAQLKERIRAHLQETYATPDQGWDEIKLYSEDRHLTGEFHFGKLDDVEVPDDGSWGYSSGWVPDDVITAVARQQNDGSTDLSKFLSGEQATDPGPLKAYYAVEVKSITSGDRVRLTENQQKMLPTISKNLDRVHPVVVTVDLNGLPETAEVTVNMYENSDWADGQISKTV